MAEISLNTIIYNLQFCPCFHLCQCRHYWNLMLSMRCMSLRVLSGLCMTLQIGPLQLWCMGIGSCIEQLSCQLNNLDGKNITLTQKKSRNRQNEITNIQRHKLDLDFQRDITGRVRFETETRFVNKTIDLYHYNDSGVSKRIGFFRSGELTILSTTNPDFVDGNFPFIISCLDTIIAAVFFIIIEIAALLLKISAHVINIMYCNYTTIKASWTSY